MRTCYSFTIEAYNQTLPKQPVRTKSAEIVFKPRMSDDESSEHTRAEVTLPQKYCFDDSWKARGELVKVLVRHTNPIATVISHHPYLPDVVRETLDPDEPRCLKLRSFDLRNGLPKGNRSYDTKPALPLAIDINSDSPTISQYYRAIQINDPLCRCVELFKIIEHFSGPARRGEGKATIKNAYDKKWWIPPECLNMIVQMIEGRTKEKAKPECYFWNLRSKCVHMKEKYGITPMAMSDLGTICEGAFMLDLIVRHSMEKHEETRLPRVARAITDG